MAEPHNFNHSERLFSLGEKLLYVGLAGPQLLSAADRMRLVSNSSVL